MAKKKKHPRVWEDMTISMQHSWGSVAELFKPQGKPPAKFKLVPFDERSTSATKVRRLQVTFNQELLKPNWRRMIFDTFGRKAPPKVDPPLPKWQNTPAMQKLYERRLGPIIKLLHGRHCIIQRIQGRYETIEKTADKVVRSYFQIRAAYLPGCVKAAGGKRTDLVIFASKAEGGGPRPDGGGTGPPTISKD